MKHFLIIFSLLFIQLSFTELPWGHASELFTTDLETRSLLDQFVLHPSTDPRKSLGEKKSLPSGLEVYVYKRKKANSQARPIYMIHFIGNASRAETECPDFLSLFPESMDPEIWSVNYPGYGGSKGEAKLSALAGAALDVYDQVSKVAQGAPIWVSSFSIGTLSSLYLASVKPFQAVILRNPVPLKELILKNYGWASWVVKDIPKELNSIENAAKIKIPALILSSEKDQVVDPSLQKKIMDAYAGSLQTLVLPGAGHNDHLPESLFPEVRKALENLGR